MTKFLATAVNKCSLVSPSLVFIIRLFFRATTATRTTCNSGSDHVLALPAIYDLGGYALEYLENDYILH
jgi:hypothetical protein